LRLSSFASTCQPVRSPSDESGPFNLSQSPNYLQTALQQNEN
jgi:hypothetical protein